MNVNQLKALLTFVTAIGFIFSVFLISCKPELDVNAPYKEIPVVYGLLNQKDSVHYVKITKAFIGETDAKEMAQNPENSEYGDQLTVKIEEVLNGIVKRTFSLLPTLISNKEAGIFYSPEHYVYSFTVSPSNPLNQNAKYVLKAVNTITGAEIQAETNIINDFDINYPTNTPQQTVGFANHLNPTDLEIKWESAKNARRYEIKAVFNYAEVNIDNRFDTIKRQLVWNFQKIKSKTTKGDEEMKFIMSGNDFFGKIALEIPDAPFNIERHVLGFDLFFSVAGEELNTYMEVSEPATGIIQEKPEYTNISGGIGIFSSRYNNEKLNKGLSKTTVEYLRKSELTRGKGFLKYYRPATNDIICIEGLWNPNINTCE